MAGTDTVVQLISAMVLSPGTVADDSWRPKNGLRSERKTGLVGLLDNGNVLRYLRPIRGLAELSTERSGTAKGSSGRFPREDWSTSPSEGADIECRDRSASDLAPLGERS